MSHWRPGDRVAGRFVVEGFLASGGMAEIYVAEMTLVPGVKRHVALKRIHSNLAEDPHFVTMFLDEARVASQLQHAGVVPVRDVIEVEGELLLVLDYVPGWDLASLLRKAREKKAQLSIDAAIYVARSIAETLDYVHAAVDFEGKPLGIVHRDVNPSNIHLADDGSVRLLDFGVAKAAARMTHTATSAIKGKLAYLAPEQASNGVLDARTDLYGLGLIVYEMVTGARAMKADGDLLLLELARAPKHAAMSELRAGVPAVLEELVARLLAVDPRARPSRGAEVAAALKAIETPKAREELRGAVITLMGAGARAIRDAQRPLDVALRAIAGLTKDEEVTPPVPAPQAPPPTTPPVVRDTTLIDPPKARAAWIPRAVLATAAIGALIFGTVAVLRGDAATERTKATTQQPPPPAAKAFLRVTSDPAGAAIAIDGRSITELTPAIFEIDTGTTHAITVSRDDHLSASKDARAIAGSTTDLHFTLERKKGRIDVNSEPAGAQVTLDGTRAGSTPLVLEDLARKPFTLKIEAAGHRAKEERVDLSTQSVATITAVLEPEVPTGTLDISSTPWARVHVDGRLVAESTPVIGLRLKAGKHTVTLSNPRSKKSAKRSIDIKARERASLIVDLNR